jgi:ADP-heptose:LPS heptosyltransferase
MLDTAALIKELDLVVTIDSSIAHLAGLMQKPVIMLSRHAGCWRWLHRPGSTNWYPSMQVVQQSRHEPWQDVLARIDLTQGLPE